MKHAKTVLFMSRRDDRPHYDTADSMVAALQSVGIDTQYEACFLEEVSFIFDGQELRVINTRNGKDLSQYGGIFLLGWFKLRKHEEVALAVSLYAERHGIPVLNTEARFNRSRSKLSQYVWSALNGISTTPYVMVSDNDTLIEQVKRSSLHYPLIAKSVTASRGGHNYLVRNEGELREALRDAPSKAFVVQTFVPNDGDYRVLVMGSEVKLIIHRRAAGESHLNNTSQGGAATLVGNDDVSPKMLEEAIKIAQLMRREVTGVDMIIHRETGEHFFLEANNMPQLSTGSFVAEKARELNTFFTEWAVDITGADLGKTID